MGSLLDWVFYGLLAFLLTSSIFGFICVWGSEKMRDKIISEAEDLIESCKYDDAKKRLDDIPWPYKSGKDEINLKKSISCNEQIQKAHKLINEKKYLEAIDELDDVVKNCKSELFARGGHDKTFERILEEGKDLLKETKYKYAVQCCEYKDYVTARKLFIEIIDYKDSKQLLTKIKEDN